jgi:hypothetical protein
MEVLARKLPCDIDSQTIDSADESEVYIRLDRSLPSFNSTVFCSHLLHGFSMNLQLRPLSRFSISPYRPPPRPLVPGVGEGAPVEAGGCGSFALSPGTAASCSCTSGDGALVRLLFGDVFSGLESCPGGDVDSPVLGPDGEAGCDPSRSAGEA